MMHLSGLHQDEQGIGRRATLSLSRNIHGALTTADGEPFAVAPARDLRGWGVLDGPAVALTLSGCSWAYLLPQSTYDRAGAGNLPALPPRLPTL